MPIKMSKNVQEMKGRLNKMPAFYDNMLMSIRKGDAVQFVDQFKKNIRHNRLNLEPLAEKTVASKKRKGYSKPDTPLYGLGDEGDKTYINMFLIRKIKDGWKAYPRWAKHHDSDLQLRELFEIHEYGRTIVRGEVLIRIEPRPVAWLTYKETLLSIQKREHAQGIKEAITQYINNGDAKLIQKIAQYGESVGEEYEKEE